MDGEDVIESLDSIWFFSNILSSPTTQPYHKDTPKSKQSKPITSSILQHPQVQSPDIKTLVVQTISTHSELVAEAELHKMEPVTVEKIEAQESSMEKQERRGRDKSSLKRRHECSQGKGFSDMGLHLIDVGCDGRSALVPPGKTCGYQRFGIGSPSSLIKMPPFNDGMAMKEHLKSWAYAVACTVR